MLPDTLSKWQKGRIGDAEKGYEKATIGGTAIDKGKATHGRGRENTTDYWTTSDGNAQSQSIDIQLPLRVATSEPVQTGLKLQLIVPCFRVLAVPKSGPKIRLYIKVQGSILC